MKKKKIHLKLIIPKRKNVTLEAERWENNFSNIMTGANRYSNMAAAIPIIAGLTPRDVTVTIEDENIEEINFKENVDIVGITGNTSVAPRMYEIATVFRNKGVSVILGGVHVSIFPYEGLKYANSIVVGEAELFWKEVINDFKKNRLKKIYKISKYPDLNKQPFPRYEMIKNNRYAYYAFQTIRGCSFSCDFCYVHKFLGKQCRMKSVPRVIQEVKQLIRLGMKKIYFCDDHFAINSERAKQLLKGLVPLNIMYGIQARMEISEDEELLDLLHESGCINIIIGFESINQKNIDEMGKGYNVEKYREAIHKIQSRGLLITGSFMVGMDNDGINVFQDIVDFVKISGIGNCCINILTPLPGTDYYYRMKKEGRLIHEDWTYYDCRHVCFTPKKMSVQELQNGFRWMNQRIFELDTVYQRVMKLYEIWNINHKRLREPLGPLLLGLSARHVAYSYPIASCPLKWRQEKSNNYR